MAATKKRADFALPKGKFPLNTAGRRKVAPLDAKIAEEKGTITESQEKRVVSADKKAKAKAK